MPYAMPNEALVDVLLPAYTCQHFGKCPDATWFPSEGHVPRGFLGATRALEEVEVVMVLAEPGPQRTRSRTPRSTSIPTMTRRRRWSA